MFDFLKKKKPVVAVDSTCVCGHDVMLHGFQNMGCSVMVDVEQDSKTVQKKCTCAKYQAKKA